MKLTDMQAFAVIVLDSILGTMPNPQNIQVYRICHKILGPEIIEYFKSRDMAELQEQADDFLKRLLAGETIDNPNAIDPTKKVMSKSHRFKLHEK